MARFDDGKDQEALRTIGEVADALGIKQHVLRYWEQQFPVLQPLKRSGGRRYYRPHDIALIEAINRLVNHEGYTLKGAKKALSQRSPTTEPDMSDAADAVDAGSETPPAAALAEPLPLVASPGFPFTTDLPDDGGLEAFFGAPAEDIGPEPESEPQSLAQPVGAAELNIAPEPEPVPVDRADLLASLKAIRARLAAALAA